MSKKITIVKSVKAPASRVYEAWLNSQDLMNWYSPGNGWTIPYAEIDAVVGGKFKIGFRSPDGKQGFDFTGKYTKLEKPTTIQYLMDDGRTAEITLDEIDGVTKIIEVFEMELVNSEEKQREGWSAQIDSLVRYLESNKLKG